MKNGLLVWNIVLTLVVAFLLVMHFSGNGSSKAVAKPTVVDSGSGSFRIAYFEMDSVENNLELVKDVKAEIGKAEDDYSNKVSQLDSRYQQEIQKYQARASTMTQEDYEKAQVSLRQFETQLKKERQKYDQDYQNFVMTKNMNVKKQIEEFLTEYNKSHNYSYIMMYEQGLFYYKDTAYNITDDVISGLNASYKK